MFHNGAENNFYFKKILELHARHLEKIFGFTIAK